MNLYNFPQKYLINVYIAEYNSIKIRIKVVRYKYRKREDNDKDQ